MTMVEVLAIVLSTFVGITLIAIALFVLKTAHDRPHNIAFSLLYTLSGIKSLAETLYVKPVGSYPDVATLFHEKVPAFPDQVAWSGLAVACGAIMPALLLWFAFLFPQPSPLLRRLPFAIGLFALPPLFFLVGWFGPLVGLPPVASQPFLIHVFTGYNLAYLLGALTVLGHSYATTKEPLQRNRAGYVLAVVAIYAILSLPLVGLTYLFGQGQVFLDVFLFLFNYVAPLIEVAAATLIAYGIVRYQALGVEFKIRAGAKVAIASGSSVTVFFVSSNTLEELFGQFFEFTSFGFLAAALLAGVLFFPIQIGLGRLFNRLMPTHQGDGAYVGSRTREIYRAQAAYVMSDVRVTDRERKFLANLAAQLGLSTAEAERIEEEVERSIGREVQGGPAATV